MTSKFHKPTPASPGSPVTWLRKLKQQHSRGGSIAADVPCGDCNACCHETSVFLEPDEVDKYRNVEEVGEGGRSRPRLERNEDQSCVYLDDEGACSIYENRPRLCRNFDCRPLAFCGIRVEHKEKLNQGLDHWDLSPRSSEDREVLLALDLCRRLFSECGLQGDVASAMFFAMLDDARPLARATLKKDRATAAQVEDALIRKWSSRMIDAGAKGRIGE